MEVVVCRVCEAMPMSGGDIDEVAVDEADAAVVGNIKELASGESQIFEQAVLEGGVRAKCKEERRSAAHEAGEHRVCNPY